jgi:hypothetical protein
MPGPALIEIVMLGGADLQPEHSRCVRLEQAPPPSLRSQSVPVRLAGARVSVPGYWQVPGSSPPIGEAVSWVRQTLARSPAPAASGCSVFSGPSKPDVRRRPDIGGLQAIIRGRARWALDPLASPPLAL